MSNWANTVTYTGVTNDLYYEICEDVENAISREKQIKSWPRAKKVELVREFNEKWLDLYDAL